MPGHNNISPLAALAQKKVTQCAYPAHYYAKFVELAQGSGSGLGRKGTRRDVEAAGRLLNRDKQQNLDPWRPSPPLERARDGRNITSSGIPRAVAFLEHLFPNFSPDNAGAGGAVVEGDPDVRTHPARRHTFTTRPLLRQSH